MIYVYALKDASGPRYTGSSSDPRRRLYNHVYTARHDPERVCNPRLVEWLNALPSPPEIVILAHANTRERAEEIEEQITADLSFEFDLLNIYAGRTKSEASKRKLSEHSPSARLTPDAVRSIRALLGTMPIREIARRFGVGKSTVGNIASGNAWRHVF